MERDTLRNVLEELEDDEDVNLVRADTVALVARRDDELCIWFRCGQSGRQRVRVR